jgi:hypothetical protein
MDHGVTGTMNKRTSFGRATWLIPLLLLQVWLLTAGSVPAFGQDDYYCVFVRTGPQGLSYMVGSRIDLYTVSKCSNQAHLSPDYEIYSGNMPGMSFQAALQLMDWARVTDDLTYSSRCYRGYQVWKSYDMSTQTWRFTYTADPNFAAVAPGWMIERGGLCCEEAAAYVNPAPIRDCRSYPMAANPNVIVSAGVRIAGPQWTITAPGRPPIVLAGVTSAPSTTTTDWSSAWDNRNKDRDNQVQNRPVGTPYSGSFGPGAGGGSQMGGVWQGTCTLQDADPGTLDLQFSIASGGSVSGSLSAPSGTIPLTGKISGGSISLTGTAGQGEAQASVLLNGNITGATATGNASVTIPFDKEGLAGAIAGAFVGGVQSATGYRGTSATPQTGTKKPTGISYGTWQASRR